MGIYDREYYRRDGPSFLGALPGFGQACKWLILINIVCFVLQLVTRTAVADPRFDRSDIPILQVYSPVTAWLELDTNAVLHGQVWRLLTYAFLHDTGTLWHILFNMLFLWWFGKDVEDLYGPREFLAFYLVRRWSAAWRLSSRALRFAGHGTVPRCFGRGDGRAGAVRLPLSRPA